MKRLMLAGLSVLVMATVVVPFASNSLAAGTRTCNGESLRFCTGNGR
ncbi:MAG: hypothetical protein HC881_17640 [Leptolyngbyaceae cyanobacterium SL_7_1]|nr:hypothetical protein [Leptolyngbyaceae cyanobacterium SL_7_1]